MKTIGIATPNPIAKLLLLVFDDLSTIIGTADELVDAEDVVDVVIVFEDETDDDEDAEDFNDECEFELI